MSLVTMTCVDCGAQIKTESIAEASQWSAAHDAVCPAQSHTDGSTER